MLSITYFRASAILSILNAHATAQKNYDLSAGTIARRKCLRRVLPASMRHFGNFRLDKRSRPKVKVSVRNYTATRRFFNKKASGC
jgi:hypothetical protein